MSARISKARANFGRDLGQIVAPGIYVHAGQTAHSLAPGTEGAVGPHPASTEDGSLPLVLSAIRQSVRPPNEFVAASTPLFWGGRIALWVPFTDQVRVCGCQGVAGAYLQKQAVRSTSDFVAAATVHSAIRTGR